LPVTDHMSAKRTSPKIKAMRAKSRKSPARKKSLKKESMRDMLSRPTIKQIETSIERGRIRSASEFRSSGAVKRGAGFKPRRRFARQARIQIIETALELLETLYVHLPLKRSMYAVNPVQRLKLLRRRCEQQIPAMANREFFNELLSIFCQLRDLHTNFVLPEPFPEQHRIPSFSIGTMRDRFRQGSLRRDSGDVG
jgi:hypothetical protein